LATSRRIVAVATTTSTTTTAASTARSSCSVAEPRSEPLISTSRRPSTAYVIGRTRAIGSSASGSEVTGQKIPLSRPWGTTTIGMNWRTWNSLLVKVEMKIPRFTAPSASSSVTRNASPGEPALAIPSPIVNAGNGPMAGTSTWPSEKAMITATWSVAKKPKPIP
jgi:hypothetical protein